ncbi:MAG TPA: MlaD family protein [Candidatus Paceibacterota bacterium]|nr:MlaD family protein [Verrucomicrobiota bacterium]HRY46762.1 MlaD family protein [Candidatus Paceibacterota bacterium]HSA00879.1 MlaD family protein [Candidatus Paceibacterota bacterium]
MNTQANYFKLGLFILIGLVIATTGLVVFGLGSIFRTKIVLETYLDESVQGLDLGAKVKFRGVPVGNVSHIGFTSLKYDQQLAPEKQHHYVLVEMKIDRDLFRRDPSLSLDLFLKEQIARGLRARLSSQGITGLSYVEIDYVEPGKFPVLPVEWTPSSYYIPSAPSTITRFIQAAEQVFDKLDRIDIEALATNLQHTVVAARAKIHELDAAGLSRDAREFLIEVKQTAQKLQEEMSALRLDQISTNLVGVLSSTRRLVDSGRIDAAIAQLETTLRRVDRLMAGAEVGFVQSIDNVRALTDSLRDLAESSRRYPAQLLLGEPPPPVKVKP